MSTVAKDAYAARLAAARAAQNAAALFAVLDGLVTDLPTGMSPEMIGHVDRIAAVIDAGKVFATQAREYLNGP
ncbi:hypothetical protein [Sediminicoccus sp. KRV36]|uniref:hypothetical protein n=1 Tax=Sediminicoccus sp. KRV36 TaxID=3133721 RepID=UPI00200FEB78|nr:hypothetical protein [Sediminicoccus rosea]UPY36205.1 hypothetical protein LHU95_18595 [Sediminicoccus rosea]